MNAVKNPYLVEEGSPGTMVGGQHEGRATGEMARAEEDEGGKREQIKAPTSKFVANEQLEYKVDQHKLHGMLHRCTASVLGATSPGSSSELTQLRRLWYFPIDLSGWFSVWKGGQQDLGQLEIRIGVTMQSLCKRVEEFGKSPDDSEVRRFGTMGGLVLAWGSGLGSREGCEDLNRVPGSSLPSKTSGLERAPRAASRRGRDR
ncbi:hypothetical protein DFH09DRAFT_1072039 [Mycena vulgaris]|nr:hypothetical protein DFH09DRAFT_1072039 [Mycena vulgaris]